MVTVAAKRMRRSCAARWPWVLTMACCSPMSVHRIGRQGHRDHSEGLREKKHYDLILTGVQAEDGGAQVGGMLAAMLDYPFASLVNSIEVWKAAS